MSSKILKYFVGRRSYKWIVKDWISIKDLDLCTRVLLTERFRQNLETLIIPVPGNGKSIMIIAPHQDDETIGAGGTLLKAKHSGSKLTCVYITDGSKSSGDIDKTNLRITREKEAENVWMKIGGKTIFLRHPDGNIPVNKDSIDLLAEIINEENPSILFVPFLLEDHIDHRNSAKLFFEAIPQIKNKKIEIWSYQVWSGLIPNVAVDITDFIGLKDELNSMWVSQNELRDFVFYSNALSAYNSKYINTNSRSYYEIFFVLPLNEYRKFCANYFIP